MRALRSQSIFVIIALALALPAATVASPTLDFPAQANLLTNGSMDGGFSDRFGDGRGMVPNGWEPWYVDAPSECYDFRPVYTQGSLFYDGGASAMIWLNHQSYTAGLKQTVSVPAGSVLRFTAYGRLVSADEIGASASTGQAAVDMKIGIDPTGGSDPHSGAIVWSATASAVGEFQLFSVDATAQGGAVTVFLYSRPRWCTAENGTYFDAASLVVIGEGGGSGDTGGGAAAPPPAPQPVSIEVAPPRADGSIVHVVQPNQYLNLIAGAYGVSVRQIKDLNGLTSNIIYTGDELLIRPPDEDIAATAEAEAAASDAAEAATAESHPTPIPTTPPQEVAAAPPPGLATGNLCVLVFNDRNRNGARDPGEGLLAGADVTLSDGQQNLTTYTTTDLSTQEPHCFKGLTPADYYLMISGANLAATAHENVRLAVPSGQTVQIEHGAVPLGTGAGPSPEAGTARGGLDEDTAKRLGVAIIAAAGAMLAMTLLGGAIYMVFLRKSA